MAKILILYSTVDGQTLRICIRLKRLIEKTGQQVTLLSISDCANRNLEHFDKIVIGASIRYGRHRKDVFDFIESHLTLLDSKPNAFFSVNIVARKPEKNTPETNPYLRKFLRQTLWRPKHLAVFAGKLDYPKYRAFDRLMIRLIMWMTHGPTDPATVVEFTDWRKVEDFGRLVVGMQDGN